MNERMERALFEMYDLLNKAELKQEERGASDQGNRSKVTSGKHMDPIAKVIAEDLMEIGCPEENIHWGTGGERITLPGWFRAAKAWDLLVVDGDNLLAAVELKSQNSAFGNNFNNRAEEVVGSAIDARHAIDNAMVPFQVRPPELGYALVLRDCDESRKVVRNGSALYPVDETFRDTSYLDRYTVLARRMLAERIYQAVWIVYVKPEEHQIIEPDRDLSYDVFIETLKSQYRIARARS